MRRPKCASRKKIPKLWGCAFFDLAQSRVITGENAHLYDGSASGELYLDTPRQITDTAGNVVWDWQNSDPFGNNMPNENPSGLGTFEQPLRHRGQVADKETGLFQNYFRDYDPAIGRYVQPDPIGLYGGSRSLFIYVGGNPISRVDPWGLAQCTYSISSHTLVCSPNDPGFVGPPVSVGPNGVFSGLGPCTNDPSCANYNDVGPIVPGKYNMNEDTRPGHEDFWRLEPDPKIPGWKCRLGMERCGFELHPGGRSLGCITADKNDPSTMQQYQNVNNLLQSENGDNHLTVKP